MSSPKILLVYDKQCPVCSFYCQMIRIRESVGELELVDAREPSEIMDEITSAGLDVDQGMVLKMGEVMYYGSDAIHMLSLIGSASGIFNRLNYWMFRSKAVSSLLYPVLKSLRNIFLKILGRTKINNLHLA